MTARPAFPRKEETRRLRESKGPAGGGGAAERSRGERRDRRRRDKGKNDEKGATARWHEGRSENLRETAKRDRKRRTPKGGRRLAHHTPLLKIPVWWRRAVLPSLPWVVCFLSFLFTGLARRGVPVLVPVRASPACPVLCEEKEFTQLNSISQVTSELQVVGKAASTTGSGEGSLDRHTDMGAKQRQDQGTGRGAREERRMDRAPVHGMGG